MEMCRTATARYRRLRVGLEQSVYKPMCLKTCLLFAPLLHELLEGPASHTQCLATCKVSCI